MTSTARTRSLGVLLVIAMLLAACGGADESASTTDPAPTDAAGTAEGSDGGTDGDGATLTVWTYYVSGGQIDALDAQNELFAETHPDVEIEHVQIPFDQLAPRLLAGVSTQQGPDIVFDNVVVDFPALASSGGLLDLTPYWESYEDAEQFPESAVWTQDGLIYNVMSYTNLLALYYNADILDELGIDPPTTVAELEDAMADVSSGSDHTPLAMSGVASPEGAWMFMPLLLGEGVDYCSFESAPVEEAFSTIERWSEEDYIPTETATWNQADAWQAFASGSYAFGINGNWNLGDVDSLGFEVGTTMYPGGSAGSVVFPGGEGIGIGSFSENPDLAWEYLQTAWLSADAGLINFGQSGQIPTRGDLADAPEVEANELVAPFVEAAGQTANWPGSPNTAAMQNLVGQSLSNVISGGASAADATAEATEAVTAEIEDGGGTC